MHNLQKLIMTSIVKNNIIAIIPNCPNQRTNSNTNPLLRFFIYTTEPSPKYFFNISRWWNVKSKVNDLPNQLSKWTPDKKMFHRLMTIAECL
jgi:hypothetical protein